MWFKAPFCFAVPTRFLRRMKQQQQIRKISGLSATSLSIECVSGEFNCSFIDFELSLKHVDGIMYIFVTHEFKQNFLKNKQKLEQFRVGQFYCHFMAYFSATSAHRSARQMPWLETKWKFRFSKSTVKRYFPLFSLPFYIFSRRSLTKLTTRACFEFRMLIESQNRESRKDLKKFVNCLEVKKFF